MDYHGFAHEAMIQVDIESHAIRIGARFAVAFQRTLRVPDDGRIYPLPPGFGALPVFKVADHANRLPPEWREQGGAFIPMCQREALWLSFAAASWKPNAVKVAIGRVNAISGEADDQGLRDSPQNYIVCPEQPWLDGINSGQGSIRQFVAMPLGGGYTVEASVRGREEVGGIQITMFEPKPGRFPDQPPARPELAAGPFAGMATAQPMGLGAGGVIRQKIYPDPCGIETWDQENFGEVVIHILNSEQFREVTGLEPPPTPIDAKAYAEFGLPWFDLYDEERSDIAPAERLARTKTIAEMDKERGKVPPETGSPKISESQIKRLRHDLSREEPPPEG
jgi:hypothetical protein